MLFKTDMKQKHSLLNLINTSYSLQYSQTLWQKKVQIHKKNPAKINRLHFTEEWTHSKERWKYPFRDMKLVWKSDEEVHIKYNATFVIFDRTLFDRQHGKNGPCISPHFVSQLTMMSNVYDFSLKNKLYHQFLIKQSVCWLI